MDLFEAVWTSLDIADELHAIGVEADGVILHKVTRKETWRDAKLHLAKLLR